MPNSLLATDTLFPRVDENKTQNENLRTVTNYLYMLVEELRYTFANLGVKNFNEVELRDIANIITKPVYVQLHNDEGKVAALLVQVEGLFSRMQSAEGAISTVQQTAEAISIRVQSAEGGISALTQTSESLSTRISSLAGNYSSLNQTVNGLSSRVQSVEGNYTTLTQTTNALSTRVQNAEGGISQLTQTANGLQSTVSGIDGRVSTVQQTINGLTVTDWYGRTYINGAMIQTGTVTANYLIGEVVGLHTLAGDTAGQITITGADTSSFATDLTSYGALRLQADNGAVHISSTYRNTFGEPLSTGYLQLSYMSSLERMAISCGADTVPNSEQRYLGASRLRWAALYAVTGTIQTSDRQKKHAIEYELPETYGALFDRLKPARYKYNDGTSDRYHTGFIAQDVEESLKEAGLSTTDFAGFVKSPAEDGYDYGLRYEEFIALNTREIQKLKARVKELEVRLQINA